MSELIRLGKKLQNRKQRLEILSWNDMKVQQNKINRIKQSMAVTEGTVPVVL